MTTREEILRTLEPFARMVSGGVGVTSDETRALAALHARLSAEPAEPHPDTVLLDALEAEVKREPLLLHNEDKVRGGYRGLGLIPWAPRTLREAIFGMMMSGKPKPKRRRKIAAIPEVQG